MSVILLASSLIYELTGFGFVDSIGALGLIYFSYSEGKEAFEKAAGMEDDCCDDDDLCEDKKEHDIHIALYNWAEDRRSTSQLCFLA